MGAFYKIKLLMIKHSVFAGYSQTIHFFLSIIDLYKGLILKDICDNYLQTVVLAFLFHVFLSKFSTGLRYCNVCFLQLF